MLFNSILSKKNIRAMAAFILSIVLIMLVGCDSKDKTLQTGKNPNVSINTGVSDENSSNESTTDENSSDDSLSNLNSSKQETASKQYDFNAGYSATDSILTARADAKEVIYNGNCAALYNPLKGYADKEAEALRNSILNSKNTEDIYEITGTKYYVSASGDDNNDGKSEKTPLRTIDGLSSLYLKEGDAVLFERGSIFRTAGTISAKSGVIYGCYGEGDKPKIYAAPKSLTDTTLWSPTQTKNIWKVNYPYKEVGGVFFNHGETIAYKKNKVKEINNDLDFYHDEENGILYLQYSKGNPAKYFESIEASTSIFVFSIPSKGHDVVIDNICIKYCAYMGIRPIQSENISITNCEIGYIGGKNYNSQIRFGNGIEIWAGAKNIRIENNWIYQVFDSAITWQGDAINYSDITIKNNLLEYNNGDIEFWSHIKHKLQNVLIDGNIMRFNALGWGTRSIDAEPRGIEGIIVGTSDLGYVSNFKFTNNIIDSPARVIIKWDLNKDNVPDIKVSGNKVYVNEKYRTNNIITRNLATINYAKNIDQLKEAFAAFDPSAELYWYK